MVAVLLVLVGVLTACDEHSDAAREVPRLSHEDAEVFLKARATPAQVAAVRRAVLRSKVVDRYAFLSRDDAVREFRRIYRDEPDVVATARREDLPPSFRVILRDGRGVESLRRSLRGVDGFDEVVDRHDGGRGFGRTVAQLCGQLVAGGTVDIDAEAFMAVAATTASQDAVRAALERAPEVERYHFVDQHEAFQIFSRVFAGQQDAVSKASPESLPSSFRIWFRPDASRDRLLSEVQALADVDEVKTFDPKLQQLCRGASS
jgi:cell division protein FtsX